jgi:hypothetical protein
MRSEATALPRLKGRLAFNAAFVVSIISSVILPTSGLAFEGCLENDITVCLSDIAPRLTQTEYDSALQSISNFDRPEINGKLRKKGNVTVFYNSKDNEDSNKLQYISMDITRTHRVTGLSVSLSRSPILASTDKEYNETHMFEAALFALGDRSNCNLLSDKHAFYLLFHNKIRPTIRKDPTDFSITATDASAYDYYHSDWQRICGRKMQYVTGSGTSTITIDENNPSGDYGGPSLEFK